jgi:hypothetical protein
MTRSSTFALLLFVLSILAVNSFAQKAGEVVFSKTLIDASKPGGLTKEFQAGERIYAMAFLEQSIFETLGSEPKKVDVEVFLYELQPPLYSYQQPSEMQLESNTLNVSGSALQKPYLPLDIVPAVNAMTAYGSPDLVYKKFGSEFYGPVKFADALSQLKSGKHTVIVKLSCNYKFVAEGKFVIQGNDYAAYKSMAKELNESASNTSTKSAVMPRAAKTDRGLESEMIGAFKASNTYKDRIKGEVLRVVIVDGDWMIRRNELTGVILHRYIRAAFAVKNSDGSCTVWPLVTFQQDYVGNKFQKTKFDGVGDPYKIPCESVNK